MCIRISTERPVALHKGSSEPVGIDEHSLLQVGDTTVEVNISGDYGIQVLDFVKENVSTKVVKII